MMEIERKEAAEMGQLDVKVGSDSMFFGRAVPIEVRDSNLRLVAKSANPQTFDLPTGLYEVSAVLEDGRRYSEVVDVAGGSHTPVSLSLRPEAGSTASELQDAGRVFGAEKSVESTVPSYQRPRFTRSMVAAAASGIEEPGVESADAQLVEVYGASLVRQTRTLHIFQCASNVDAVPSALFQIGSRHLRISLPISPQTSSPSGSCAVKIERTSTGVHAQAWITPERTVANALQNMLSSGYLLEAARVADDAIELLRSKYEDPTGAALGALLLHKVGRLHRWESWVENLARDFSWLADGKVLLAQLHYERNDASSSALELAVHASQQRMLYAESYSLLIELLRRWPSDRPHSTIETLARNAPYVDWESVCLSEWLPDDDD